MKKKLLVLAVAFMVILTLSPEAFAANCNSPPTGSYGPAWAAQYQSWCVACCGKFSMSGGNPTCTPDSNWGCKGQGSSGAAGSGLYQPFYNLGYGIGQSIGKALFGDPQEEARKRAEEQWRAAEQARVAEIARQEAEAREAARKAEEAHKRQETFDRLSSQLQLSEGFSSNKSDLTLMLGDGNDGLRPQGTSFFGLGGGTSGSNLNNDSKVVDLRPPQGYSVATAAPANPGDTLPLIMGDPNTDSNVVDLRDKKAPLVVDPKTVKESTHPTDIQLESDKSKRANCEWGNMGSSVVDLRCLGLDPNKPITVDPHVVRGQQRVFPAQVDPATFQNANYNKGFEALMRFDVASAAAAVEYFKQAQKERPNDPLVRNALLLAQDIHKARQQKEKDDHAKVAYFTWQSYASLMMGDIINARYYIAQARKLDPNDNTAKWVESLARLDLGAEGTYPGRRDAYRLVANSLVSIYKHNYPVAIDMIEAAQRLQPEDRFIGMFLQELRNYEPGRASANTGP